MSRFRTTSGGTAIAGSPMLGLVANYRLLTRDTTNSLQRIADLPEVSREVEYYRANISQVKSIEDLLANQRLFSFAMTAFGLGDMVYAKGMMRKALTDGLESPDSFSLRLSDTRFRDFVETFNFKSLGSATTAFDRTQQGTIDRYLRQLFEEKAGETNEGLRLALYFERKATDLASVYSILADKAIYQVVRTTLSLPDAISASDIDKQAQLLDEKINIEDFNDSKKLSAFIVRFLSLYEIDSSSAVSSSPALAVLSAPSGIQMNTLLSLQTIKRFGS